MASNEPNDKSLESWIWDAACSIRGAKDAPKYKEFILPLIFTKRLCDVFDDELNRIAKEVGSRAKAFKLVKHDKKLVRFYLPLQPANPDDALWSVLRQTGDVEADIIGRSYEYLIRKFAEGGGQSAGEFYTPGEVGEIMALIMDPEPGMTVYDPTCGSAGLLIKCELALEEKTKAASEKK